MARVYSKAYRSDEPAMTSLARVYAGGAGSPPPPPRRHCLAAGLSLFTPDTSHVPTLITWPDDCHADVNVSNPKEYWDYENLAIDWG